MNTQIKLNEMNPAQLAMLLVILNSSDQHVAASEVREALYANCGEQDGCLYIKEAADMFARIE